jgi:hypothetical protein
VGSGFACTHGYYPARLNAAVSLLSTVLSAMSKLQGEDLANLLLKIYAFIIIDWFIPR